MSRPGTRYRERPSETPELPSCAAGPPFGAALVRPRSFVASHFSDGLMVSFLMSLSAASRTAVKSDLVSIMP